MKKENWLDRDSTRSACIIRFFRQSIFELFVELAESWQKPGERERDIIEEKKLNNFGQKKFDATSLIQS